MTRLSHCDVEERREPARRPVVPRRKVNHSRQGGEQRVEWTFVATEKATDNPGPIGAAAAALVDDRERRRRTSEQRHVRRGTHPRCARQAMRVPLREDDEISFIQPDRLLTNDLSPAGAVRDQVVLDHALGARHHHRGNLLRWRCLRHPWRAQFEVEVHRAGQTDRSKHVRQDVS